MIYHPGTTLIKSSGNAFNWQTPCEKSKAEKAADYKREYERQYYAKQKAKKQLEAAMSPRSTFDVVGAADSYEGRVKYSKLVGAGSPAGYSK